MPNFSALQRAPHQIDPSNIPRHIAIIPDGNRRWAKKQAKSFFEGHREGASVVLEIVKKAKTLGIDTLTVYTFSTENWKRPQAEVDALMFILEDYLKRETKSMVESGICFHTIGNLEPIPASTKQAILEAKNQTKDCSEINFILAINYGARDEMLRAFKHLAADLKSQAVSIDALDEQLFKRYLDTAPWKDPDLLIRTSGEKRLSNFLLWQIPYTEIYFTPVLWPDFTLQDLIEAILEYQRREKRLGR
ncbi:MAG: uppS [Chlamydiales bacterium]|jgi:undecaprenyl diphosphate synthase|nr:uppS [Chlamydiales bacterium]